MMGELNCHPIENFDKSQLFFLSQWIKKRTQQKNNLMLKRSNNFIFGAFAKHLL
jgi:hypothetical protein